MNYMQAKKIIKLASMGGFVTDAIMEEVKNNFSAEAVLIAKKYCELNGSFITVLSEVEKSISWCEGHLGSSLFELMNTHNSKSRKNITVDSNFRMWYADNIGKYTHMRLVGDKNVQILQEVPENVKSSMKKLNDFDSYVLGKLEGMDTGTKRTVCEVAKLPEISCKEEYIEKLLEIIHEKMESETAESAFEKVCREYRESK